MIFITFFAISGLAFTLTQMDGAFDLLARLRNLLLRLPLLGPHFFFHLLNCNFCMGFWSAMPIYMAMKSSYSEYPMLVIAFAGGIWNLLFNKILDKLSVNT